LEVGNLNVNEGKCPSPKGDDRKKSKNPLKIKKKMYL
jgi:hypothetical protein